MLKMRKMLAVLTAVILVLAACGTAAAEQEVRRVESAADADEWIAGFLGEHPEEMDGFAAYARDGKVREDVIADIASFILEAGANP